MKEQTVTGPLPERLQETLDWMKELLGNSCDFMERLEAMLATSWPIYDLTVVIFPLLLLIIYAVKQEGKRY